MSNLNDARNKLKSKLENKLPGYTIYTRYKDRYDDDYIILYCYYDIGSKTSDAQNQKIDMKCDLEIGSKISEGCLDKIASSIIDVAEEKIESDLETIFKLGYNKDEEDVHPYNGMNNNNITRTAELTLNIDK